MTSTGGGSKLALTGTRSDAAAAAARQRDARAAHERETGGRAIVRDPVTGLNLADLLEVLRALDILEEDADHAARLDELRMLCVFPQVRLRGGG
jgi:hypothetical protein